MYHFSPMTEEELSASNIMEVGIYDFEVLKSTRKNSKSGNPMAELNIAIWDKEGKQTNIFDYLVFSKVPLNIKKVKHFCDATGLSKEYEKGELPEELNGLNGKVQIGIQDETPKSTGGFYPKKNIVIDYIILGKKTVKPDLNDDDVPF